MQDVFQLKLFNQGGTVWTLKVMKKKGRGRKNNNKKRVVIGTGSKTPELKLLRPGTAKEKKRNDHAEVGAVGHMFDRPA